MNLKPLKCYNPVSVLRRLFTAVIILLLPTLLFSQATPELEIYKMIDVDSPLPDSIFLLDITKYIKDTLFFGGGKLSDPHYVGNSRGVGLFRDGQDIGFPDGMIISNGYVGTTVIVDGGENKTGAQALPMYDSLGPRDFVPNGPPALRDADMDWLAGLFTADDPKPDTAVDPSYIIFKFKPFYGSIKLDYVFASEEYKYQQPAFPPPPPPPIDVDFTSADVSDFMAIFIKRFPSEQNYNMIASMIGQDGDPSWRPVCVKTLNHTTPPGYYDPNYDKSFIFDGASTPRPIFPFITQGGEVAPCQTYWIKIAVADYPNGQVVQGYNLSHQINSAVFLKAFSLMSDYGLEWTVESAITNNDFASDTTLVEGGCSDVAVTIKFNTMPRDTTFLRMRIDNANAGEYIITPPLLQDSLIMIPDSIMEYTLNITAVDDNINEGTNGREPWFIRYTLDPCDVPTIDTSGIGQAIAGYTGLIKVFVQDYNPYVNTIKTYGPDLPPPGSQYHCVGDVSVTITDVLQGGLTPYTYNWSNPPDFGSGENFTTTIEDSPDFARCVITDRCSGKPGYIAGIDTVIIYSKLEMQASNDFQLCQNGQTEIQVESTNVGHDFTTIWYFQGNVVGNDSIYNVTWTEYGQYAPNTITFTCVVTDECGNTDTDEVQATFFPVVTIQGVPLICLYETIQLICSGAQSYQWYYNSFPGTPIPGATSQILNYTPTTAGFHTICVSIINDCGEQADTCFSFEVSQLILDMTMNNSGNFNTCPNVPFTLEELNAFDGWAWSWEDDGTNYTATGQTISLELAEASVHPVTVIAYNINGCLDTITRQVTVYPMPTPRLRPPLHRFVLITRPT